MTKSNRTATFSTACSQYTATISGCHSLQEAVFVTTLTLGRLECTFHCSISIYALSQSGFYTKWAAKVLLFFDMTKKKCIFFAFECIF